MKAYPLIVPEKGKYLAPVSTSNTVEFVKEDCEMSMIEHMIDGSDGHYKFRFRLHTRKPASFEDTLEYDIGCPRCATTKLRLCGRPLDAYDHGLYKCPVCDKH